MEIPDILGKSLCKNCIHMVSRTISTEGLPVFDEVDEQFVSTVTSFISDEDAVDFEQYSCSVLCIDLDHIVLDCNKFYENKYKVFNKTLIRNSNIIRDLLQ